jgi:hypothetical protein
MVIFMLTAGSLLGVTFVQQFDPSRVAQETVELRLEVWLPIAALVVRFCAGGGVGSEARKHWKERG